MKGENHKFTFEGKEYDGYSGTQKQRQIERTIRKLKRRKAAFKAAGLTLESDAAGSALNSEMEKYKAFSRAAGLPKQMERMRVLYT